MSETKSMLRPCLVVAFFFAVLSLLRIWVEAEYNLFISGISALMWFILLSTMGVFSLWLHKRRGNKLNIPSFFVIISLTVVWYIAFDVLLALLTEHIYPSIDFYVPTNQPPLHLTAVAFLFISSLSLGFISLMFLTDPGERNLFGGERTTKTLSYFFIVVFAALLMWQMDAFSPYPWGRGYAGFELLKPVDHGCEDADISIVWVNRAEEAINVSAVILEDMDCGIYRSGLVKPGEKITARWTCEGDAICPPETMGYSLYPLGDLILPRPYKCHGANCGSDSYYLRIQVNYTTRDMVLTYSETGIIWGPC